jgi:glycosyltransferase involved in cell wall biosynthesis
MTDVARPLRVTVVAPVHRYDNVRVFQKEARSLAAAGHRVTLFAQAPSAFVQDLVAVVPAPRARNRLHRYLLLPWVLVRAGRLRGDVYHLHNPDCLPLGLLLKALGRAVVYDTHEDFLRRIPTKFWVPRPLRAALARLVAALEWLVGRVADASIATEPQVVRRLGPRAVLIENAPVISGPLIEDSHAYAAGVRRGTELRAVYLGTVADHQGLRVMVDALELANQRVPCRLWLIGPSEDEDPSELERARALPGWRFVDHLGRLSQAEGFGYLARADVSLVPYLGVGGIQEVSANKLYECLCFGVPFIASDFPRWRSHVGEAAGCFVPPGDVAALGERLIWCAGHLDELRAMGARGREFVMTSYNWETEVRKLLEIYHRLASRIVERS